MSSTELTTMHDDHREWKSEDDFWQVQVREWEREVVEAIGDLTIVEQTLRAHERSLQMHAAAVRVYDQVVRSHEHQLAQLAQEGACSATCCTKNRHRKESERQAEQRQSHETLKRTHYALMAQWSLFLKALAGSKP